MKPIAALLASVFALLAPTTARTSANHCAQRRKEHTMKPTAALLAFTLACACDPTHYAVVAEDVPAETDRVVGRTLGGYSLRTNLYDLLDGSGKIAIATLIEGLTPSAELRAYRGDCLVGEAFSGVAGYVRMQPVTNCGRQTPPPSCEVGQMFDGSGQCAPVLGQGSIEMAGAGGLIPAVCPNPDDVRVPVFQGLRDACSQCSCPKEGSCDATLATFSDDSCGQLQEQIPISVRRVSTTISHRCSRVNATALRLNEFKSACSPVRQFESLSSGNEWERTAAICLAPTTGLLSAQCLFFEGERACPATHTKRSIYYRGKQGESSCTCACTPSAGSCRPSQTADIRLTPDPLCGSVVNKPAPPLQLGTCSSSEGYAAIQISNGLTLPACTASGQHTSEAVPTGALTACCR